MPAEVTPDSLHRPLAVDECRSTPGVVFSGEHERVHAGRVPG